MFRTLIIIVTVIHCADIKGQEGRGDVRFIWYNVENFFDPFDDSLAGDDEFLPGGTRHWTWERFERKKGNIARVIAATGGWEPPEIIALAEIENSFVIHQLCRESPLLKYNYRWIHHDSHDPRGMDIALLYLPTEFRPLHSEFNRIFEKDQRGSRDILYVKGLLKSRDTLHLILNHWPSRWGGRLETEQRRITAARACRRLVDSILASGAGTGIIVAGDFNDETGDRSLEAILEVIQYPSNRNTLSDAGLYAILKQGMGYPEGSLKYRGKWFLFDHVFLSGNMIKSRVHEPGICGATVKIFQMEFLFERDIQWTGWKPRRTWIGWQYQDGFSDHLPLILDLYFGEARPD